jgi:hypothetical protein
MLKKMIFVNMALLGVASAETEVVYINAGDVSGYNLVKLDNIECDSNQLAKDKAITCKITNISSGEFTSKLTVQDLVYEEQCKIELSKKDNQYTFKSNCIGAVFDSKHMAINLQ